MKKMRFYGWIAALALFCLPRPAAAAVTLTVKASGGATYTTIQAAVNDVPGSLSDDYYILVQDTWTYNESVTVQGKATNGYRIVISSDGALTDRPFVSTTTANAFTIKNSSVTINGFRVTNTGTYAVYVSSLDFSLTNSSVTAGTYGVYVVPSASGGSVFVSSNALSGAGTGGYGFYLNGGGTANSVTVSSNAVSTANGVYIASNGNGAVVVSGNVIITPVNATRYGINLNYLYNGATVQYNDIRFTAAAAGYNFYGIYPTYVFRAAIHHNTINAPVPTNNPLFKGIYLVSSPDSDITFNDISANPGSGQSSWLYFSGTTVFSTGTYIAHNILSALGTNTTGLYFVDASQTAGTVSNYNDLFGFKQTGVIAAVKYAALSNWQGAGYDAQSVSLDPLWVSTTTATPDFHLKSPAGRYSNGSWVTTDTSTSSVIDRGDPTWDYSLEPTPNGGRVNMGRYGNTPEASKSPSSGSVAILETGEWYPTLSQALTSLSTNTITGDRTVEISAGTYLESASPLQTIETNSYTLTIRNASGVNNVVFDGALFARTIGLDLKLTDTSTAVVSGITFKNYTTYGIKVTNGSSVTIDSVTVSNSGTACIYEAGVKNSFDVVRSSAAGCTYAVQAAPSVSGGSVFVSSNALSSTNYGFYLNGSYANSVTVSSNTIYNANGVSINNNQGNTVVSGNLIKVPVTTTRYGIYLQNLSNGATVQYNDIRFTAGAAASVFGMYLQSVYHPAIHHNTINSPDPTYSIYFNGVYLVSSPDADIMFNDVSANPGNNYYSAWLTFSGATVYSTGAYIAHNILSALGTNTTGLYFVDASQTAGTVSNYNDLFGFKQTGVIAAVKYAALSNWQGAGYDAQSVSLDPLWVSTTTATPDFHLKSPAGRYSNGSWVTTDTSTSSVIDKGDPTQAYSREPQPNGCRVNMGRYGNTAEASKSTSTIGGIAACGLKYYDGTQIVTLACESACDAPTSKLRFFKEGVIYGLPLVDIADPNASTLRINVPAGIKAIRKFP
ncbi:MAG: hypothetical protein A2X28_06135 [Elusimicrobia bacterium GWA2_56_46]|nr:MAG: hypothetical protein A2X28_06135 [Elusimicrobia bacterium GWA2_56_46]OGR54611.1 MAG: hypothetical protein A2X39_02185 [Elusimicrobia bacterium GWC2_56_31]